MSGSKRFGVVQRLDRVAERCHREDVQAGDNRGLACIGRRQQDARQAITARGHRDRKRSARGVHRSVERQLAEQHEIHDVPALHDTRRREDAERDRQIEGCAGLSHVGRRQIDRDAVGRKLEAGVADREPHALAALAHARIRQTDHREGRNAERYVDLDVDRTGIHAEDRCRPEAREHRARPCKRRPAITRRVFSMT